MDENQISCHPILTKFLDLKEDNLFDRYFDIFDPIIAINDIFQLKDEIVEESIVGDDEFNLCESSLVNFCLPWVFRFPDFFRMVCIELL